eukprot:TRINITY_DN80308_c0_g1_i1.p1 TRINITY_DN80308_c0_g1~~TRINITY_DN80308_c0_g1_i1.p1  ORF type:complete len:378 (-),score=64.08 TRINITY_DN80308_c0_g1_i1:35-1105(-)
MEVPRRGSLHARRHAARFFPAALGVVVCASLRRSSCFALHGRAEGSLPAAMEGRLFKYRTSPGALQAFESPPSHSFDRFCIYLGGLTDGLLACDYVHKLQKECEAAGWALVQPIISSSYAGYGTGSLTRDNEELESLVKFLRENKSAKACAIVGHSTGCQNAVYFMKNSQPENRMVLRFCGLQAPVSDREAAKTEDNYEESLKLLKTAEAMVADGRGEDILMKHYGFVPMTASRFASLLGKGGPDDMFSSDFQDEELRAILQHMSTGGQQKLPGSEAHPGLCVLMASSMADEYVPKFVDRPLLAERLCAAMAHQGNPSDVVRLDLEGANHNLAEPADGSAADAFAAKVGSLLAAIK